MGGGRGAGHTALNRFARCSQHSSSSSSSSALAVVRRSRPAPSLRFFPQTETALEWQRPSPSPLDRTKQIRPPWQPPFGRRASAGLAGSARQRRRWKPCGRHSQCGPQIRAAGAKERGGGAALAVKDPRGVLKRARSPPTGPHRPVHLQPGAAAPSTPTARRGGPQCTYSPAQREKLGSGLLQLY